MRDILKLLLVLCTVTLITGAIFKTSTRKTCTEGQYKFREACFQCTPCGNFMYEQDKCSATSNTVCGWCGKKPNLEEISDEVMVSYQTKCLMSSLNFIGMTKLKDELVNVFEENMNEKQIANRDTIISGENLEIIDASTFDDHFKIAKDSLNSFDDSTEQELPDPTLEEGKDSASAEEDKTEEAEDKTEKDEDKTEEVDDDTEEEDDKKEEADYDETAEEIYLADTISEKVENYLKKGKVETREELLKRLDPAFRARHNIITHAEVAKQLNSMVPDLPIVMNGGFNGFGSSEESNEREIKWDNWVDDEVKPIGESVEIVEAEEIRQPYDAYVKVPRRRLTISEKEDIVSRLSMSKEFESELGSLVSRPPPPPPPFLSPLIFACLGFIILATIIAISAVQFRAEGKTFTGVPTDSQDYHMIIDSSKYVEELQKKEKQANRHVHINPTFDV